jgi:hypothetical protein
MSKVVAISLVGYAYLSSLFRNLIITTARYNY